MSRQKLMTIAYWVQGGVPGSQIVLPATKERVVSERMFQKRPKNDTRMFPFIFRVFVAKLHEHSGQELMPRSPKAAQPGAAWSSREQHVHSTQPQTFLSRCDPDRCWRAIRDGANRPGDAAG